MDRYWHKIKAMNQQKLVLLAMLFLTILFAFLKPSFLSSRSIDNVFRVFSFYGTAALGMTFVILTGGIDLSVGSNMALAGSLGSGLLGLAYGAVNPIHLPFAATFTIALVSSGLIGFANGLFVTKLHIPSFVATLGTMSIVRGLVFIVNDTVVGGVSGSPITFMHPTFEYLGLRSLFGIIPTQTAIFIVLAVSCTIFLHYSRFGRNIYAVGGNKEVARLAGIKTDRSIIFVYTFCGIMSGLSGLMLVGKLSSASTIAAKGYELDIITAVVLGGASMFGGRGTIVGTSIGVVFLSIMNNGLDMLNVPSFFQYLIKGFILIVALVMDRFFATRKMSKRSAVVSV